MNTPDTAVEITRSVPIYPTTEISIQLNPSNLLVPADPLSSPIFVGGDEGCMCAYFLFNNPYFDAVRGVVLQYARSNIVGSEFNAKLHFNVQLARDESVPDTAILSIEIYDGAEKTASFKQRGVRYDPDIERRIGRDRGLLNGYFLENAVSVLLHDNVWTHLLRNYVSYVPRASLMEFLAKAAPLRESVPGP